MKKGIQVSSLILLTILILGNGVAQSQSIGTIVAWGNNDYGQCIVPSPNTSFIAISAGCFQSMGLKVDGTIVAWGCNDAYQSTVPLPNTNFVSIAAGAGHDLGLKADGTIIAWGFNNYGQCEVPLPNTEFVSIGSRDNHSLGLKSDGVIVAWERNDFGQCDVPSPNTNFVAVAVGFGHSLGLRSDGVIIAWGRNNDGQCNVPPPNVEFIAIAGGFDHSLALKSDGTIVAWGNNDYGQCDVPSPNTDFISVAGGYDHSLGLKSDGTIVAWGKNNFGQCDIPSPNSDFIAIAGGNDYSMGLKAEQPVAVTFSGIDAESIEGAVILHWETATDEALSGFILHRAMCSGDFSCITGSILSPDARSYEDRAIEPGREYRYMVAALTQDGREIRSIEVTANSIATPLMLGQNVPNPFNPSTIIEYSLPGPEHVRLDIYDINGRLVQQLIDKSMEAGHHQIEWSGRDEKGQAVASGVYYYRLTVGKQTTSKKMILLR